MIIIKNNKNLILIISLIFGLMFIFNSIKRINNKYINFQNLKEDFESLKQEIYFKGYDIEMNNLENFIVIKRDNIRMYFNKKWIKTEFDDMMSLNKKYEIKDLIINSNGKLSKQCHHIKFKSYEIETNKELNNYFDFNFINIEFSSIRMGFSGSDNTFSESYVFFKNEIMSDIELNSYCNEAKSLERFLAYKY